MLDQLESLKPTVWALAASARRNFQPASRLLTTRGSVGGTNASSRRASRDSTIMRSHAASKVGRPIGRDGPPPERESVDYTRRLRRRGSSPPTSRTAAIVDGSGTALVPALAGASGLP